MKPKSLFSLNCRSSWTSFAKSLFLPNGKLIHQWLCDTIKWPIEIAGLREWNDLMLDMLITVGVSFICHVKRFYDYEFLSTIWWISTFLVFPCELSVQPPKRNAYVRFAFMPCASKKWFFYFYLLACLLLQTLSRSNDTLHFGIFHCFCIAPIFLFIVSGKYFHSAFRSNADPRLSEVNWEFLCG